MKYARRFPLARCYYYLLIARHVWLIIYERAARGNGHCELSSSLFHLIRLAPTLTLHILKTSCCCKYLAHIWPGRCGWDLNFLTGCKAAIIPRARNCSRSVIFWHCVLFWPQTEFDLFLGGRITLSGDGKLMEKWVVGLRVRVSSNRAVI